MIVAIVTKLGGYAPLYAVISRINDLFENIIDRRRWVRSVAPYVNGVKNFCVRRYKYACIALLFTARSQPLLFAAGKYLDERYYAV